MLRFSCNNLLPITIFHERIDLTIAVVPVLLAPDESGIVVVLLLVFRGRASNPWRSVAIPPPEGSVVITAIPGVIGVVLHPLRGGDHLYLRVFAPLHLASLLVRIF